LLAKFSQGGERPILGIWLRQGIGPNGLCLFAVGKMWFPHRGEQKTIWTVQVGDNRETKSSATSQKSFALMRCFAGRVGGVGGTEAEGGGGMRVKPKTFCFGHPTSVRVRWTRLRPFTDSWQLGPRGGRRTPNAAAGGKTRPSMALPEIRDLGHWAEPVSFFVGWPSSRGVKKCRAIGLQGVRGHGLIKTV